MLGLPRQGKNVAASPALATCMGTVAAVFRLASIPLLGFVSFGL